MKRSSHQFKKNERAATPRRERDPIPWRYCLLTLICGVLLVGGFFLAARQHFSAIDYGIKNAKLRRERENLEAEQQRLKLAREVTLSPAEIKKAARKIGLREMTASNIEVYSSKDLAGKTTQNSANKALKDEKKVIEVKNGDRNEKKPSAPQTTTAAAAAAAAAATAAKNEARSSSKSAAKADKKGESAR